MAIDCYEEKLIMNRNAELEKLVIATFTFKQALLETADGPSLSTSRCPLPGRGDIRGEAPLTSPRRDAGEGAPSPRYPALRVFWGFLGASPRLYLIILQHREGGV